MKKEYTYKVTFYSWIGIIVMIILLSISNCNAQIQIDKKLHFTVGASSAVWFSCFAMPQNEIIKPAIYGLTGAFVLGSSKELYDLAGGGTAEWNDLGATMLGAAVSTGIIIGVRR